MAVTTPANLTNTVDSISNVAKALKMAMPLLAYPMFGKPDDLPKRQGQTLKWYRGANASESTASTTASSPAWSPQTHTVNSVTATLDNFFGAGIEITEDLENQSVWDMRPDILRFNAEEAGRALNGNTRQTLISGAGTTYYANGKTSATFTSADTPDMDDFLSVARQLQDQDAPPIIIDGQECYVAFISPKVQEYLMKDSGFKAAVAYGYQQRLFFNYLATYNGICFVRTSTANNGRTTVTGVTADQTIVVGADAYGVPSMPLLGMKGQLPDYSGPAVGIPAMVQYHQMLASMFSLVETLPGNGGSGMGAHGDEYAVKHKATWKAKYKTVVLNSNWIVNFRSAN